MICCLKTLYQTLIQYNILIQFDFVFDYEILLSVIVSCRLETNKNWFSISSHSEYSFRWHGCHIFISNPIPLLKNRADRQICVLDFLLIFINGRIAFEVRRSEYLIITIERLGLSLPPMSPLRELFSSGAETY